MQAKHTYADQRAHDVNWMTAKERADMGRRTIDVAHRRDHVDRILEEAQEQLKDMLRQDQKDDIAARKQYAQNAAARREQGF